MQKPSLYLSWDERVETSQMTTNSKISTKLAWWCPRQLFYDFYFCILWNSKKELLNFWLILKNKKGLGKGSTSRRNLLNHFLWPFAREEYVQDLIAISVVFVLEYQKIFWTKTEQLQAWDTKTWRPGETQRCRGSQRYATLPTDPVFL